MSEKLPANWPKRKDLNIAVGVGAMAWNEAINACELALSSQKERKVTGQEVDDMLVSHGCLKAYPNLRQELVDDLMGLFHGEEK